MYGWHQTGLCFSQQRGGIRISTFWWPWSSLGQEGDPDLSKVVQEEDGSIPQSVYKCCVTDTFWRIWTHHYFPNTRIIHQCMQIRSSVSPWATPTITYTTRPETGDTIAHKAASYSEDGWWGKLYTGAGNKWSWTSNNKHHHVKRRLPEHRKQWMDGWKYKLMRATILRNAGQ